MPDTTPQNNLPFPTCDGLAKIGFFSDFSQEVLEKIAPLVKTLSLPAGSTLFHYGEPHQDVIQIICSGVVRQIWPDGKARERYIGEVLGISSYLDNRPHGSTIIAQENCEFLLLPAEELRRLEATSSSVSDAMDRSIAEHIHHCIATAMEVAPFLNLSVTQVMKAPIISLGPDATLREAYQLMRHQRIGSLVIMDKGESDGEENAGNSQGKPIGLLTCLELHEAIWDKGLSGEDKVISAGYQPPHEIPATASLRQAEHLQERKGIKYLIVTKKGSPIGILSQTDILRAIAKVSPPLLAEIKRTEDIASLHQLYLRIPRFAADIRPWNRSATATISVLNEAHQAILQHCVTLTLAEIVEQGGGAPPGLFALVLLGSGGRSEMLLTPDQDNAIILADEVEKDPAALQWFAKFTDTLNKTMAKVGYRLCPGEIMARNPSWQKGLSTWRRQFNHIIAYPNPKAARWANIALDLRHLYGDEELVIALRREIAEKLREKPRLLRMMVEDDAEGRPPLGFFNRLITTTANGKKHRIDLKRNALRIVADVARVYAWREGIDAHDTVGRLQGLVQQGVLSYEVVKTTLAAYDALLDLYMDQKLRQALESAHDDDHHDDKLLDHDLLSPHEQELLRISLRTVKRLQKRLQQDFEIG
ncbi:MAG: CBS domain-containing protein [Gammaproteobacteria bacterium]|nr:CBS domain-containing protein [Gammaproteobacteria bacterium]NNJ84408.1 CBS domain-containing protein [Gammaproteobacteria bacterium]